MALKLRLARGGSKKRPYYKIVVADARAPRDGRFIEQIGHYNPMLAKDSGDRVGLNNERIAYWLVKGAQPTDRVLRFLDEAGLAKREARNNPNKGEPGAKAKEREEERKQKEEDRKAREEEEKQSAAAAAAEAAKEAADSAAETASDAAEAATGAAEAVADAVTDTAAAAASAVAGAAASVIEAVTGGSDDDKGDTDEKKDA